MAIEKAVDSFPSQNKHVNLADLRYEESATCVDLNRHSIVGELVLGQRTETAAQKPGLDKRYASFSGSLPGRVRKKALFTHTRS